MILLSRIIGGAPWWAFPLLALLVVLGLQATRSRTVRWQLLVIAPAVFIAWGIARLVARSAANPLYLADWSAAAACGIALAMATRHSNGIRVDRNRGVVHIAGSWLPLVRYMLIFLAKYALAAATALVPSHGFEFTLADIAVSGVMAGYFSTQLIQLLRTYWLAPNADLRAATSAVDPS
jgi:hypothetical protein